jgi:hypothetical protein
MWVRGEKVFRAAVQIRKVAAAAAGDQDLFADSVSVVQHRNALAMASCLDGTHQACRAGSENEDIKDLGHCAIGQGRELLHYALLQCCSRRMHLGYAGGMAQGKPSAILGFHQDEQDDWVADLACGHTQHVRHRPPWTLRPWVIDEEGRREHFGTILMCKECMHEDRG